MTPSSPHRRVILQSLAGELRPRSDLKLVRLNRNRGALSSCLSSFGASRLSGSFSSCLGRRHLLRRREGRRILRVDVPPYTAESLESQYKFFSLPYSSRLYGSRHLCLNQL